MSTLKLEGQPSTVLLNFLSKLGLKDFYPHKLSLRDFLEINKNSISDDTVQSVEEIPWYFLRKLLKINTGCRNCEKLSTRDNSDDEGENNDLFDQDFDTADDSAKDNEVNPLDLIVALFLCADGFMQQEMAVKMSMCQFSVPLLLPRIDNSQCTLMLWALRDIVKEWCPQELSKSKGFIEESVVRADVPFYSFVRLKNCSLSKSQSLNHVLSLGKQNHDIFIHRDMEGGSHKREIANGLVEVCWYLPCGNENLDIFPNPVALANLRGDLCESPEQFQFLFEMSTATFVFLDKVEEKEHKILTSLRDVSSKLFLVVNRKDGDASGESITSVRKIVTEMDLKANIITKDRKVNAVGLSKKLCEAIKKSMTNVKTTTNIENMADMAVNLGLSVEKHKHDEQKKAAEETIKGTRVRSTPEYKDHQLPLQGSKWKRLSQLEKEECRLRDAGDRELEEYKSQLQAEKQQIKEELGKQKLSKAMESFIEHLSESDKEERDFFLKWMKLHLNARSRSALQNPCKTGEKDVKKLGKTLLDCSLGIEHYMREVGLIYEFSLQSQKRSKKILHLPVIAAEMLLDGYPLELLDGDASNIPERWVTDVLMELHKKAGGKSRLLVVTVLGVQSTGKSTLLNTMFGVQFPVSSGRCTRGAYMLFLKVGEDMQCQLDCDFLVLIDTEGLKSPHLAQLEDSYEHDNQLATFVIGLSDIAIINVAMENSTEMKDILQIVTHAFLRMKEIGKKPVCHFVHQNVGGVSAHAKTLPERKHLLDQLNEMTQLAAKMEKQPSIQAFTDVLDYDIEKNSWNIPGLWHGTPPMAPVNTGYSEAVAGFKKNLLSMVKRDVSGDVSQIPEFLEWIRSLWKAVKYENFIFSFRNTLVAHAYDNLCKEFTQWEWEFRKEILTWKEAAELEITNASDDYELHQLVESKKSQVAEKISDQQKVMTKKLQDYYKKKDIPVHLIEKYKADFSNSIKSFAKTVKHSVNNELDCALELKKSTKKALDIQRKHRQMIEEQVMKLLSDCKRQERLSDEKLKLEFDKMWEKNTANVSGLKEEDISAKILKQLKENLLNRNVNEELQNTGDLQDIGKQWFQVKGEHIKSEHIKSTLQKIFAQSIAIFRKKDIKRKLQSFVDSVIESCERSIVDTAQTNKDYHDSFTKDLLEKVDDSLKQCSEDFKPKFEIDLKLHICGIASRKFREMHRNFLKERDPRIQLEKYRPQYLSDFLDLYKERDDCQRKAADFVKYCIKPAVEKYIHQPLGRDIVDEILTSSHSLEYSSRSFFQYNIQEELLQKEDFQSFVKYIQKYEIYVKDWIFQRILKKMSVNKTLSKLKNKNLQVIAKKITEAIERASKGEDGVLLPDNKESITKLVNNMRQYLIKDISISVEAEKSTLFQIQSTFHSFKKSLIKSLSEMQEELQNEFSSSEDVSKTLNQLPIKPQDELFKRVFGCGRQCPFCEVPCEAGGWRHEKHHAAVHRPQGLGAYRVIDTNKLVGRLCTTSVHSERKFRNKDTKNEFHPYKEYTTYYPDWRIPPDRTIEASDYWKYVLVQYNDRFAKEYEAEPADVPEAWTKITKEQALKGLKDAFNMK